MIQVVTLDSVAPQRWRNGGGSTRALWVGPAALDWQWRVSVATIEQDGPFSAFADVERHFAVLSGAGVRLHFADRVASCTLASGALRFDGDDPPQCALIDGPTLDLNLMVRGGAGIMRRVEPGADWHSAATHRALWCSSAATLQVDGHPAIHVPAAALAHTTAGAGQSWQLGAASGAPAAWWIGIEGLQP